MIEVALTEKELDHTACLAKVLDDGVGGISTFIGTVRNQSNQKKVIRLEFEAYKGMALSEMQKIAEEAVLKYNVTHVVMHHRTGVLEIGEIPVIIIVGSAHRKEAFSACQYCIETLKETVPIWKHEFFEDGDIWVAAHP